MFISEFEKGNPLYVISEIGKNPGVKKSKFRKVA